MENILYKTWKIYCTRHGKYTVQDMENILYKTWNTLYKTLKIYCTRHRKYCTRHGKYTVQDMENILYKTWKIYCTRHGKYTVLDMDINILYTRHRKYSVQYMDNTLYKIERYKSAVPALLHRMKYSVLEKSRIYFRQDNFNKCGNSFGETCSP